MDETWHNAALPADVDQENGVNTRDALLVVNELIGRNYSNAATGTIESSTPMFSYDADNDQFITPQDVLLVINRLFALRSGATQAPLDSSSAVTTHRATSALQEDVPPFQCPFRATDFLFAAANHDDHPAGERHRASHLSFGA